MADNFKAIVDAELNLDKVETQIKELNNKTIKLKVELSNKDTGKELASNIQKGLKATKIDTSAVSKQLAESFNIKDSGIKQKLTKQLNDMMASVGNTWNGKRFDFSKADGFYSGMDDMAKIITDNASMVKGATGIYDEFYDYFKNKKIYVSDELKNALGGDTYKELLKDNIGKITTDITKGMSIDSLWGEMTDMFPEHFSKDMMNQADQIVRTFEVVKKARADMAKVITSQEMTPEQKFDVTGSAYDQIISASNELSAKLQSNIMNAMQESQNVFDLQVNIDGEKIASDIRTAVQSAMQTAGEGIDVKLRINDEELTTNIRTALNTMAGGNEPVSLKVDINKADLEADLNKALDGVELPVHFKIDAAEIEADIRKAISNIKDVEVNLRVDDKAVENQTQNIFNGMAGASGAGQLYQSINNINNAGRKGQSVFQSFNRTLTEAFSTFTLANMLQDAIYKVGEVAREAVSKVKELNDASLDLRMATGESESAVSDMMEQYNQMGQELGALTTEVSSGADAWLRQGKTAEETTTLIKDSMVLSKVAGLEASDATKYLTSAMQGYKVEAEDVSKINDKLTSIDLASATDAGGLAEGMSKVAVTADSAGVSMDRLLGMLATVGEVTQDGMSEVGNSMKTIFTRMSDIKAGKFELIDEDGTTETLSDVELTLKNVGIDLRKTVTEYNSFSDVLDNLASKWNTLNDTQQSALAKAFAGTRQQNRFRVLMENYDKVQKYTSIAQNSEGMAEEKFGFYADSLEAKTNSLKASLEALAGSTLSSDLYAGVLDTSKAMVDLTTQTGILKGMLAGLGTAGGLFVFEKLAGWTTDAVQGFSNLSSAMKLLDAGNLGADEFQKLLTLTDGLSKSQTKLILSYTSLSDAQKISILMSQGMSQAEAQASLSAMGLTTAQMSATGATVSLTGALQGLWATLMANPLILVAAGVTAAVTAFSAYKKSVEESVTSAREAGSSWQESSDSLQSQISRVTELKTALDNGTMTEEEAYQAKSELLSIQESLTDSYGKQAEGIDLVNGSLEEQIALLSQMDKDSANKFLNENKTGIDKATSEMEKGRHYYLGKVSASTEEGKGLQDIIDKYTDKGLSATKNGDGTFTIAFDGDVSQAEETLNDFETEVRQMQKTFTDSNILEDISQNVSDSLGRNNEILDEYQDLYKQAQNASLVADSSLYGSGKEQKTAVTWLNEYSKAIEEYNNALAEGDTSKISEASEQFATLDEKIQTLTSATGMSEYASQFEEVRNQLNQTAVAQKAFTDALEGQDTSAFGKEISKYAKSLQELSMTDIDFKDAFETDGIQKGEDAVNSLTDAAVEMGLITGKSSEEVQSLIDFLVQAGVLASDTAGKVSDTSKQIATDIATIVADETSAFNQAKKDMESANKGDTYDSMYEMAKKAKELLKSGDVGTDDFKSIAKMFSPSGADDYKNFEENLGKINRYFTEDNSGVKNFLKDLEKNDFAKYDEDTKQWTYSINDLEEAARKMGMGFEPFMAMFGELEDKGFNNDFFSTADEGGQKLSELTQGLMQSQKELANLQQTDPENSTAIEAKKAEIQEYKDRIDACKKSLAELLNENGGVEGSIAETEQSQKLVKDQVKDFNSTAKQKEYRGDNRNVLAPTAQTIIDAGKEAGLDYQLKEIQTKSGEIRYKIVLEGKDEAENDIKDVTDKEYKAEVTAQVDTKEIDNMEDNIPDEDALSRTVELIGEDNASPVIERWNEMDAPDKDTTLTGKDKATAVVRLWNYISADDKEGVLSGQDKASWVINTWNQLSPEDKQAILEADGTEATDVLSKVLGMTGEVDGTTAKPTIDATDHATAKINSVSNKLDVLDGKKATTTIETVKVTTTKNNTSSGGSSGKKKSTQAHGTLPAFANGSNVTSDGRLRSNEDALINEVEKEWVIRNGQILEFNDGYPTKAKLKRGDIVLNHKQVNQLEEKGYVKGSHAKIVGGESAFSNGTIVGNAYAGKGTGGGKLVGDTTTTKKKTTTKGKSGSSGDKGEKTTSKKWDDFIKKLGNLFDWIEVRLDVLSKKTEKWTKLAENAVNYSVKRTNYEKAVGATVDEMNANQTAESKYLNKAKSIGKKAAGKSKSDNITQKWVNGIMTKLVNGTLDITKYSDKKLDVVEKMKEWYDKSQDASERFSELTESLADLYSELENLANNEAAEKIEEIDHQLSLLSTNYDMANSLEARQGNLQAQNQKAKETMDAYNKAYSSTSSSLKQATDALGSLGISANGTTGIDANDSMSVAQLKAVAKYNAALEASKEALRNAQQAQTDYNKTLYDNAHQMFQNIIDEYEFKREINGQRATRINNAMELNETKGYRNSKVYYEGVMANDQEEYAKMKQQLAEAEAKLEENLRTIKDYKGTVNYQEEVRGINEIINAMDEMDIKMAQTQNDMKQLDWDNFDKLQESISRVTDEASFLIDELSRKDLVDSDTGTFTDEGRAVMALYAGNYEANKQQVEMYNKEIADWKKYMKDNGLEDNDEARNHLYELVDAQREYASACQESKYAMIDMAKDGLNAQKDYLQEVIDKYKDLMDKQQSAYEYQKNLNNAVEEINNVQKQIEVYSGDNSEENRARIQQLNKDLKDKQESLQDMQREKLTSDINNMFDDLMDNYGDYIDDLMSEMDDNFDDLISAVNMGLGDTQTVIEEFADSLGIDLSEQLRAIQHGNNIEQSTKDSINQIESDQNKLVNDADSRATDDVKGVNSSADALDTARDNAVAKGEADRAEQARKQAQQQAQQQAEAQRLAEEQAMQAAQAKAQKDRTDYLTALDFIKGHFYKPKSGTKASDIKDPVKKKIFQLTGDRTLTEANLDALAKKLGVAENTPLYNRLNELGVFKSIGKKGLITTISQFAKGSKNIPNDMIAQIGEKGHEIVYRSADGSILTPLGKNDMVFTHEMSENLWQMAKERDIKTVPGVEESQYNKTVNMSNHVRGGDVVVNLGGVTVNGVQNADELARELESVITDTLRHNLVNDRRTKGIINETVKDMLLPNHNSLSANKYL